MTRTPALSQAKALYGVVFAAASLALTSHSASAQTVVYSNDFSSNANGFSSATLSTTPGTGSHAPDQYLGNFGNSTVTLSLTGLTGHSSTTISFDLYAINTLDGNGPAGGGADPFDFTVSRSGGVATSLLSTNFANFLGGNTQDFGGSNGAGGYLTGGTYAPQTGAAEINTLYGNDSVYHFSFTFLDTSSSLAFNFVNGQNQGVGDESIGYDNVVVSVTPTAGAAAPEPSALALLLPGIATGLVLVRRRSARRN